MNILEFTALVFAGSLVAGLVGSLTGLGGGVVLVPLLTLFFKVDIRYAIGASLVSVIATSSGAAAAGRACWCNHCGVGFNQRHRYNLWIGTFGFGRSFPQTALPI